MRACMLPACSSFCLVPAQIWYSAVDTTAPPPTAQPSRLEPICAPRPQGYALLQLPLQLYCYLCKVFR